MNAAPSKARLVVTNVLSLLAGRLVVGAVTVATLSLLGRNLRTEQFGLLMLSVVASELFSTLADFGMSYLMVREVSRGIEIRRLFSTAFMLKVLIGVPGLILAGAVIFVSYPYPTAHTLYLGLIYGVVNTMFLYFLAFFNGLQRMGTSAAMLSGQSMLVSILSILGLVMGATTASEIMGLRILGAFLVMVASYVFLRRSVQISFVTVRWDEVTALLKTAVPFGLFFIGSVVYFQTDSFQLSGYLGEAAVGEYQAAMKLVVILELIPMNAANALYPALSSAFMSSPQRTSDLVEKITKYLVLSSLPLCLLLWVFADYIVAFLFGPEFTRSAEILRILAFLVPLRFAGHLMGVTITVGDAQQKRMIASLSAAVLNIGLNAVLIPLGGTLAAAAVSIVTSAATVSLYLWGMKGVLPSFSVLRTFRSPALVFLSLFAPAVVLQELHPVVLAVILVVIGIGAAWVFRAIDATDLAFIRSLMTRQKTAHASGTANE